MNKDLTTGSPRRVLWLYTLPLLGSVFFQQLYNLADSVVAGRFISESALAAVGNATEVTLIYTAFAVGCNVGCSVIISQLFGAKNYKQLKSAVSTAFIAFGILCGILMLLGFICMNSLLRLMQTPANIHGDTLLYLRIYTAGMPFVFFYNVATGIFSALGDSKSPFCFLVFSSLSNIGVDILFVTVFRMGIAGVAWATFLCQGLSCVLAVSLLVRRLHSMPCDEKPAVFSLPLLRRLLLVAIPSVLQQLFVSVGNIMIQGMVNGCGESVVAGFTAAIKLSNIAISCYIAVGSGLSAYTAQNIGAERPERIHPGYRSGIQLGILLCLPFLFAYLVLGRYCVGLFLPTGSSAAALDTAVLILRTISLCYFVAVGKVTTDGVLRGAAAMKQFMLATFTDLALRVLFVAVLIKPLGAVGIGLAWCCGASGGMAVSLIMYYSGRWKRQPSLAKSIET